MIRFSSRFLIRVAAVFAMLTTGVRAISVPEEGLAYFVSTDGNDTNPGGRALPLASLEKARETVHRIRQTGVLPEGGIKVYVRGGTYPLAESFVLGDQDSGTPECPITYSAYRDEIVRLVGGREIKGDIFKSLSESEADSTRLREDAQAHVLVADLHKLGMGEFGDFPLQFRGAIRTMEFFFDGTAMQLARWPNEGWVTIKSVIDRGDKKEGRPGAFEYSEERPASWDIEKGVWLHGYWCHDWYDEVIKIGSVDTEKKLITLAAPHGYGIGASHSWNKVPRRYYALNVLEELDRPGEWYLDHEKGLLYFWPPAEIAQAQMVVSLLTDPIFSLKNTSYVTVKGMTFECAQGTGLSVSGGTGNRVVKCTVRNTGGSGITLSGEANEIIGCDVYDTGATGISIGGGDRATLTPGRNVALNNLVHHFGRRQRTYAPGISLSGVGNRIAHNTIHSCPHAGVLYSGNENVIEFNEIFLTSQETGDVGALYTGRDWGSQGNMIRYNFIHHTGGVRGWSMGVYLDDCDSGDSIVGNVFFKVTRAAFIGGGRDNNVLNNVFVDCSPAVHVDDRGRSRIKWNAGLGESWDLEAKIKKYNYQQPPWSARYSSLAVVMENDPELPRNNVIQRNVCIGGKWLNARKNIVELLDMKDNFISEEDPGFRSIKNMDFRLKSDSPVWSQVPGFQEVPMEKMGAYLDEFRASWPICKPRCDTTWPPVQEAKKTVSAKLPEYRVPRTHIGIELDGDIRAEEWRDADVVGNMKVAETIGGDAVQPESTVRLMAGDDALFVALENVTAPTPELNTGNTWGSCDAVEIAVRVPDAKVRPILVYRGYCKGQWETSDEAGASAEDCTRCAKGVQYAAVVVGGGKWNAEWAIPWEALRVDKLKGQKLEFNVTVRKTPNKLWQMWQGTGGYSWDVGKAGYLVLPRK